MNVVCRMDEKPRTIADLDDDETADAAAESGPLGRLVEREIASGTVESVESVSESNRPDHPGTASTEYAEGTTEHDDDREG